MDATLQERDEWVRQAEEILENEGQTTAERLAERLDLPSETVALSLLEFLVDQGVAQQNGPLQITTIFTICDEEDEPMATAAKNSPAELKTLNDDQLKVRARALDISTRGRFNRDSMIERIVKAAGTDGASEASGKAAAAGNGKAPKRPKKRGKGAQTPDILTVDQMIAMGETEETATEADLQLREAMARIRVERAKVDVWTIRRNRLIQQGRMEHFATGEISYDTRSETTDACRHLENAERALIHARAKAQELKGELKGGNEKITQQSRESHPLFEGQDKEED